MKTASRQAKSEGHFRKFEEGTRYDTGQLWKPLICEVQSQALLECLGISGPFGECGLLQRRALDGQHRATEDAPSKYTAELFSLFRQVWV